MSVSPSTAAPKRRRFWRRFAILIGLLALGVRVVLPYAAQPGLNLLLERYGLEADLDDLDLGLIGGRVSLRNLSVRERSPHQSEAGRLADPAAEVLRLQLLELDIDMSALLTGRLRVHEVQVDGLDVHISRDAEGAWNFERYLASAAGGGDPELASEPQPKESPAEPTAKAPKPGPIELGLPFELEFLRLQGIELTVEDRLQQPPLTVSISTDLSVTDLGSRQRPARVELLVSADHGLDRLRADLRGTSRATDLDLDAEFDLVGLDLAQFGPWLLPLGIEAGAAQPLTGRGALNGRVRAALEDGSDCRAELQVEPCSLLAGEQSVLALGGLQLRVASLFGPRLEVESLVVSGLGARAALDERGLPSVGGLVLVGSGDGATASPAPAPEDTRPSTPEADAATAPGLFVGKLSLEDSRFDFEDRSQSPPVSLALELELAQLTGLELGPSSGVGPRFSPLEVRLSAPGVFSGARLAGQLELEPGRAAFDLGLDVNGFRPEALAPYLAAAGIRSTFEDGRLGLSIGGELRSDPQGALGARFALDSLSLSEGAGPEARELLRLDHLAVEGVELASDGSAQVKSIELSGLALDGERDPEGRVALLGFELGGPEVRTDSGAGLAPAPPPVPEAPAPNAPSSGNTASSPPPALNIGAIQVGDIRVSFTDRGSPGSPRLETRDVVLNGQGLALFGGQPCAGQLDLGLGISGLFERLKVRAALVPPADPEGLGLEGRLELTGIDWAALRPLLLASGIQPLDEAASMSADFDAALWPLAGEQAIEAHLSGLSYRSSEREWAGLEQLAWEGARLGGARTQLGRLSIDRPRLSAELDPEGRLLALGLAFEAPPPAATPPEPPEPPAPKDSAPLAAPADAPQAPSNPVEAASSPLALERIQVSGFDVEFIDRTQVEPKRLSVQLDASLQDLALEAGATPASFDVQLALEPAVGHLQLTGNLGLTPGALAFEGALDARDLEFSALAPYLPPGLTSEWNQGGFRGQLSAGLVPGPAGQRIHASLQGFALTPIAGSPVAFEFERLELAGLQRSEERGAGFDGLELALLGAQLRARRSADGRLHAFGFALEPQVEAPPVALAESPVEPAASDATAPGAAPGPDAPAAANQTPEAPPAAPQEAPPSSTSEVASAQAPAPAGSKPTQGAADLAPLELGLRKLLPHVDLARFELEFTRLEYLDETAAEPMPLVGRVRLETPGPLLLLDPNEERIQPLELSLEGGLEPGLESFRLALTAEPFDVDPRAKLELGFEGLDGPALARVAPATFQGLDPAGLSAASFSAQLDLELDLPRRQPLDFDISPGIGAALIVSDVALRGTPEGPPLVGLERLVIEGLKYLPATGDLTVRSVEVIKPAGRVRLLPEGFEIAGVILLTAAKPAEAPPAPEGAAPVPETPAVAAGAEQAPVKPSGDITIDQLQISGLDFEFEDRTVERPIVLPFNQLEVDLRGLSTRALREPLPVRLNFFLGAGQVELRKRSKASSAIAGFLGAAANVMTGGEDKARYEMRPLMQEISAVGRLTLAPQPVGQLRFDIAGLELPAFQGLAAKAGVKIDDGVLDLKVLARLQGDKGISIESRSVFTDLSLSEPADGPISRYLKLPAPLDSVIFLLKNQNGELVLPLSVDIKQGGVGLGAIAGAAVSTLSQVVANAVTSSPLRVTGALTGLLGIGGKEDKPDVVLDRTVSFEAGWPELDAAAQETLADVAKRLGKDSKLRAVFTHGFGASDWQRAEQLANPSRGEAASLAERLRGERDTLEHLRESVAADARGAYLLGLTEEAEAARQRLAGLDRQRQATEAALDRLYGLLRPGAEARRETRTREAALVIAGSRLDAIYAALLQAGVSRPEERLEFRPPRATATVEGLGQVRIELRTVN